MIFLLSQIIQHQTLHCMSITIAEGALLSSTAVRRSLAPKALDHHFTELLPDHTH